jgi:hypothetical protein
MSQASPDLTTLDDEFADELQTLRWRRRESNPRKISTGYNVSFETNAFSVV